MKNQAIRPAGAALMGVLLLMLAACGGSDKPATGTPASAPLVTATPASSTSRSSYSSVPAVTATVATGENAVAVKRFSFEPAALTVTKGATVRFTDVSGSHTVTADDGHTFDSGTISPGGTFAFQFNDAGTFAYHCSIHPRMTGTITVQ